MATADGADDGDLVVLIDDDDGATPAAGQSDGAAAATDQQPAAAVQQQQQRQPPQQAAEASPAIEELQRQLANERSLRERREGELHQSEQRRTAAERTAQERTNEVSAAREATLSAEYDSIVNALGLAQGEERSLQSAWEAAQTEGDFKKAAECLAKLGRVGARIVQFEDAQKVLDAQRAARAEGRQTAAAQPQPQQRQQTTESEQREAYLAQQTPKVSAWMRAHPQFFDDPIFQAKVLGAHHGAIVNRIPLESDDYFAYVEEQAGLRQPAQQQQDATSGAAVTVARAAGQEAQQQQRSYTPIQQRYRQPEAQGRIPAAAPSRDAVTTTTARGQTQVALTQAERETALAMALDGDPDPIKTYARNKLALQREGKVF